MNFISKRKIIVVGFLASLLIVLFTYYKYLNQIEKKDMSEYVPASASAFVEVNSLSALLSEIIKTDIWQKLAPQFGISKQVEYLTSAADILAFSGLGPNEASLLARAQYVMVLDSLELVSTGGEEGKPGGELEITPRFALVIETHSRSSKVEEYLASRVALLAQRVYNNKVTTKEEVFNDIKIKIFQSETKDRSIIAAQKESVLIIGNSLLSVQNCLAVLLGKQNNFKSNAVLKTAREKSGTNSMVFGFVTKQAISKIFQIATNLVPKLAAISNAENQTIPSIISSQLIDGISYSASFENGKVIEKYFALIKPDAMAKMVKSIKLSNDKLSLSSKLINTSLDFMVFFVDKPVQVVEEVLATISAQTDAVISFALRQLVIDLGKKYGISPSEPIGNFLREEVALVKIEGAEKDQFLFVLKINNKLKMLPTIGRYLKKGNEKVNSEDYQGVEIVSNPDFENRAIAFLDDYLLLGTKENISIFIDFWQKGKSQQSQFDLNTIKGLSEAVFFSSRVEKENVGDFFLGISRLLRTTDGAKEILTSQNIRIVIDNLPPSISTGKLIEEGLLIETQSSIGSLRYLSQFFDSSKEDLKEIQTSSLK